MPRSAAELMWAEAVSALARIDRMHRDFFRPDRHGWEPPVDVLETQDELVITVALPGVSTGDVELVIRDDAISVIGIRRLPVFLQRARVVRMELPHGRFERRIGLPAGRYELTRRDLADGLLVVALRKVA